MIAQAFTANIRGLPHNPSVTEINARSGPGTSYSNPFKAKVGTNGLSVQEVSADEQGTAFQNKVYQWFKLRFPDGQSAWVRDDLIEIVGDGTAFGYEKLTTPVFAFTVKRQMQTVTAPAVNVAVPVPAAPVITPVIVTVTVQPAPAPMAAAPAVPAPVVPVKADSADRVRTAAFNITAAFEGGGYATFQNYDTGIISYGRFQFTLAGSGLFKVLEKFTSRSNSPVANELKAAYLERVRVHDASLRQDVRLKTLLLEAAKEPVMQKAQDEAATENYWNVVQDLSIKPRGIRTPLGLALIFDMGINFGPRHGFLTAAEDALKLPPRSMVGTNGVSEQQIIAKLAELRKQSHDRQAVRDNLPGLRVRGDFWVNLCSGGDWELLGDGEGMLTVKPGARVKVRGF